MRIRRFLIDISKSPIRSMFLFFLLLPLAASAAVPEGFIQNFRPINSAGGIAILPSGDALSLSFDYNSGPALSLVDLNGDNLPQSPIVLKQFDSSVYPAFVKISPSGETALFGVTGSEQALYSVDLSSRVVQRLLDLEGSYDAVFIDESSLYVTARAGVFDFSKPAIIYYLTLGSPQSLQSVALFNNTPTGPLALDSNNNLYYVKSTDEFPAPSGAHRLYRFSAAALNQAIINKNELTETDSDISVPLDAGPYLAARKTANGSHDVFISQFGGGILVFNDQTKKVESFLEVPAQSDASYTIMSFSPNADEFEAFSPGKATLVASVSTNFYANYETAIIIPDEADTDGDGVLDYYELKAGSSRTDAGSKPSVLTTPVYALWNGFFEMINILEMINSGDSLCSIAMTLFDISGTIRSSSILWLEQGNQFDLIVNDLEGFEKNSYGVIRLDFSCNLTGQMAFYRAGNGTDYDFAFGLPLTSASYGPTAVSYNTFQPSSNTAELNDFVANWLSVVNLSPNPKSFTVLKFSQEGQEISKEQIIVSPYGRLDIEGGHIIPGPRHVGLLSIHPTDPKSPYSAQLIRYGFDEAGGIRFAFPLASRAGTGQAIHAPIAGNKSLANWLELINADRNTAYAELNCYDDSGSTKYSSPISLSPFSQLHFPVQTLLGGSERGSCTVFPEQGSRVIAQSMFYHQNALDGRLLSVSGSLLREALADSLHGSYNLFLEMENELWLLNTSAKTAQCVLSTKSPSGIKYIPIQMAPHSTQLFSLKGLSLLDLKTNSYGAISVKTNKPKQLVAELQRIRRNPVSGDVEFSLPTAFR